MKTGFTFLLFLMLALQMKAQYYFNSTSSGNLSALQNPRTINGKDSSYFTTATYDSSNFRRIIVYHHASSGMLDWEKIIFSSTESTAGGICQLNDSSLVIVGSTQLNGFTDILIARLDANGNQLSTTRWGSINSDELGLAVAATADGGFVLAGQSNKNLNGGTDLLLMKFNSSGSLQWSKDIIDASLGVEVPSSVLETQSGEIILCGYNSPVFQQNFYNGFLLKTTASGDLIWSKKFGGSQFDQINDVVELNNAAGYALCGRTESFGPINGATNAYLVKFDTAGVYGWSQVYGMNYPTLCEYYGIELGANNDLIVAGYIQTYANAVSVPLMAAYTLNGKQKWAREYNNSFIFGSYYTDIAVAANSNYTACGIDNSMLMLTSTDTGGYTCYYTAFVQDTIVDTGFVDFGWNAQISNSTFIQNNGASGSVYGIAAFHPFFCSPTGVKEEAKSSDWISVAPNPFSDKITLRLKQKINAQLKIYNLCGACIYSESVHEANTQIDLNDLKGGVYLIELVGDDFYCKQKLVKY